MRWLLVVVVVVPPRSRGDSPEGDPSSEHRYIEHRDYNSRSSLEHHQREVLVMMHATYPVRSHPVHNWPWYGPFHRIRTWSEPSATCADRGSEGIATRVVPRESIDVPWSLQARRTHLFIDVLQGTISMVAIAHAVAAHTGIARPLLAVVVDEHGASCLERASTTQGEESTADGGSDKKKTPAVGRNDATEAARSQCYGSGNMMFAWYARRRECQPTVLI